MPIASGCP